MAEQRPIFPIRGVIALRPDNGKPAGYPEHQIHFFTDRITAAERTGGMPLAECVITDCRWRDRPTCAGQWLNSKGVPWIILASHVEHPDMRARIDSLKPWFGPIPNPPEVTT